ncbi:MAG: hypothetical protein ACK58N_19355 [Synechocystis sp.]
MVETYLQEREQLAESVQAQFIDIQQMTQRFWIGSQAMGEDC